MPLCRHTAYEMCQQYNFTEVDLFAFTAFPQRYVPIYKVALKPFLDYFLYAGIQWIK